MVVWRITGTEIGPDGNGAAFSRMADKKLATTRTTEARPMGMSTHIIGFKPPDEKWKKMKSVWDACKTAGVEPPKDVMEFFNYEEPDPQGVEVKIPVRECRPHDGASGYEVDIASLPKDVTVIRFYNSW